MAHSYVQSINCNHQVINMHRNHKSVKKNLIYRIFSNYTLLIEHKWIQNGKIKCHEDGQYKTALFVGIICFYIIQNQDPFIYHNCFPLNFVGTISRNGWPYPIVAEFSWMAGFNCSTITSSVTIMSLHQATVLPLLFICWYNIRLAIK